MNTLNKALEAPELKIIGEEEDRLAAAFESRLSLLAIPQIGRLSDAVSGFGAGAGI